MFEAIGGVINPISILVTRIIPKWTGSTPNAMAEGYSKGDISSTAAFVSINIPVKNNKTLISSRNKILLSVMLVVNVARFCGICIRVRILLKTLVKPIMHIIEAEVFAEVINAAANSLLVARRRIRIMISVYNPAIAAASVAVVRPE